jgi:uncharacterized protein YggE
LLSKENKTKGHSMISAKLSPLLAIAVLGLSPLQAMAETEQEPKMFITATGTVTAEPDQATILFGVHSTSSEAGDAMAQNTSAMQAAFEALTKAGVAPKYITTTGLALNPRYEHYERTDGNTPPQIRGYEAHNTVRATVTDLSGLGDVLDDLVSSGVNGIDQVSFGIQDTSALEAQARAEAAKAAREKAEAYARAIGTEITGIASISEQAASRVQPYTQMDMVRTMAASSVPVSGGEMDVSVTVQVTFNLSGELK